MKFKKATVIWSFIGLILSIAYTIYSYELGVISNTNIVIFFIANALYFSLVGFIIAVFINLITKNKAEPWHLGAMLGFIAYLVLLLTTSIRSSGLMCRSIGTMFKCDFNQFFTFMIVEGPMPLHILQVFLILFGMLIGLILGSKDILWTRKTRKK